MIYSANEVKLSNCIAVASDLFGMRAGMIKSKRRIEPLPLIRGIVLTYANAESGLGIEKHWIGEYFDVPRQTVDNQIRAHDGRMTDRKYKESYEAFVKEYEKEYGETEV